MYTLGIETSCDETSCAVLKNNRVLSNITVSSLKEHKKYGGIIPEIATRAHCENIDKVLSVSLDRARVPLKRIGLIAVTHRPGLIGALAVGLNFAKSLSLALRIPFLGVNHLHAHLFSPFLNTETDFRFPLLGVVVSGGHTVIYRINDFSAIDTLGETRDDACGEAFDKVARAYNLGYPGGPVIDGMFDHRYRKSIAFKCGRTGLDLSFSGLKTALVYKRKEIEKKRGISKLQVIKAVSSFQYAALEAVIDVILEAAERTGIKEISCGGGVLANNYLRRRLKEEENAGIKFFTAPKQYSGDNAAMVAGLGFYLYNNSGKTSSMDLNAQAN